MHHTANKIGHKSAPPFAAALFNKSLQLFFSLSLP